MKAVIKCTQCNKEKCIDSYGMSWQLHKKICDYCKNYNRITPAEIKAANGTDKEVKCLKCGEKFLGRINVRICQACKSYHDYSTDKFVQYFMLGL